MLPFGKCFMGGFCALWRTMHLSKWHIWIKIIELCGEGDISCDKVAYIWVK